MQASTFGQRLEQPLHAVKQVGFDLRRIALQMLRNVTLAVTLGFVESIAREPAPRSPHIHGSSVD